MTAVITKRNTLLLGYLGAIGATVCYGSTTFLASKIVSDYAPPLVGGAFSMLFGTTVLALFLTRSALRDAKRAPRQALVMTILTGCFGILGTASLYLAVSHAPVTVVGPIGGSVPLFSLLWTHLFLQRFERVSWRMAIGSLLIVGGVALVIIG